MFLVGTYNQAQGKDWRYRTGRHQKRGVKTKRVNELNYRDHDERKEGKFLNTIMEQPCSEDGQKRGCLKRKEKSMSELHVANGWGRSRPKSAHQLWWSEDDWLSYQSPGKRKMALLSWTISGKFNKGSTTVGALFRKTSRECSALKGVTENNISSYHPEPKDQGEGGINKPGDRKGWVERAVGQAGSWSWWRDTASFARTHR